jgi:toxin ParE1/3/4
VRRYIIARRASLEIAEIVDFLSDRDMEAGERFIQQFTKKCRYLTDFPLIGKPYTELLPELRGVVLNRYIIFYEVTDEAVTIVRVVRGDRDLKPLFN